MTAYIRFALVLAVILAASPVLAGVVTIDDYTFDLDQFTGAAVTYRADGGVSFDGKDWDNKVGVDGVTCGELAAGQYGSDPGDQISLNDRSDPDWFQLNYASGGLMIGVGLDTFVVYEITSSTSGVDTEGTSWRISFNGGNFINASDGIATFLKYTPDAENVNQIVFDLADLGFVYGDILQTVRIENIDSGSGTSDPDFIFTALGAPSTDSVPEPATLAIWAGLGGLGLVATRRRKRLA